LFSKVLIKTEYPIVSFVNKDPEALPSTKKYEITLTCLNSLIKVIQRFSKIYNPSFEYVTSSIDVGNGNSKKNTE
jgi:hypothetical protein